MILMVSMWFRSFSKKKNISFLQSSKDLPWKSYYLSSSLTILLFLLFVFFSHSVESFNVCLQKVQMLISRSSDKHKVILKQFNKLRPLVHSEGSVIT